MTASDDRIRLMNGARAAKRVHDEETRRHRQENMREINDRRKNELIAKLKDEIRDLRLTRDHMRQLLREHNIPYDDSDIEDLLPEAKERERRGRYDDRVLAMSELIYNACPKAYKILREYSDVVGDLPSPKTLSRHYGEDISNRMEALKNLQNIPEILAGWREQHSLGSRDRIPCILSVDAINFKPYVQIDPSGNVTGLDVHHLLDDIDGTELYRTLRNDLGGWEDWVRANYQHILSAAFVFHLQPLDPQYSCLAIHWHEHTSGKATAQETKLMRDIVRILQLRQIKVVGLASDADNAYEIFHDEYLQSYLKFHPLGFIRGKKIANVTNRPIMICDPLHLLKRMRYRLLKGKIFTSGFSPTGDTFDSSAFQYYNPFRGLPDVVLRDGDVYKMHDSLPLMLFTPQILLQAVQLSSVLAAFLLPGVLLNLAIAHPDLTRDERIQLLCVGYYYMLQYYSHITEGVSEGLAENGTKKVNLLFGKSMTKHLLNDFRALAYILRKYDTITVSLNRCGSNPLEHCFGVLRVHCAFVHNLVRCLKSLAIHQVSQHLSDVTIHKRANSYGCCVEPCRQDEQELDLFVDSCDVVAEELFKRLNWTPEGEQFAWAKTNHRVNADFERVLKELIENPKGRKTHLTLQKLTLSACTGLKGRHMTLAKIEIGKMISLPEKLDEKKRKISIRNEKVQQTNGEQEVLEKIKKNDLLTIIAETCQEVKFKPPTRIRTKQDAIKWIVQYWKHTRGVVRNWIEQQAEIEEQRRVLAVQELMKKAI